MKESVENMASLNATQIITEKIFLGGEEIGDAILPKLVKRAPLSPTINDDDTVDENIYFTLHNDAGQCVYVSPALLESYNEYKKVIPPSWPSNRKPPLTWIVLPGGGGRIVPKEPVNRTKRTNLDHAYDVLRDIKFLALDKIPQDGRKTGWYARDILTSKYAFRGTSIKKAIRNFPKTIFAEGMFADCKKLVKFSPRKFVSCENANFMFKDCVKLEKFLTPENSTAFKKLNSAIEMFSNCRELRGYTGSGHYEIWLHTPALTNAKKMFLNCKKVETLKDVNFKALVNMESMFDGCERFWGFFIDGGTSRKPSMPRVENGKYAFYECVSLEEMPYVGEMSKLKFGTGMFYNTSIGGNMDKAFVSLTEAANMFNKCDEMTSVGRTDNAQQFPNVENGKQMFAQCSKLQSIKLNFPKLTSGENMFRYCTSLTTLTDVNLKNLNNGMAMFGGGCKLNMQSCLNLSTALKANTATWSERINGNLNGITIGVEASLMNNAQVRAAFGLSDVAAPGSDPDLGQNEEQGRITNAVGNIILTRVSWN